MKLDREEAEILQAYDQGKMNLSTPSKAEKAKIKKAENSHVDIVPWEEFFTEYIEE